MGNLVQDVKYGARMLRRSPGFTVVAVLTLVLGISSTTAIFSLINAVLLAPLPYPNSGRIVSLMLHGSEEDQNSLAVPEFMAMRQASQVLQDFCLYDFSGPGINLTGGDRPQQIKGIHVSADYFKLFSAPMALGRAFTAGEDRPHGPHVAVVSYGLWRSRFGGDSNILSRPIDVNGNSTVVTGVMGRTFHDDPPADIWLPLQADPNSVDEAHYLLGAAMLKPGITLSQADARLDLVAAAFRRRFPQFSTLMGAQRSFKVQPLRDLEVNGIRPALLVMLGAVSFVLLIACANVANLLLARATIRKREIAIRAAIGAGRGRIVRQLLTESVLLSLVGGALGLIFGYIGVRALLAVSPVDLPRTGTHGSAVGMDWRVLVFAIGVSVFTGILFGLIPAFSAARADLNAALKESATRSGTSFRQNKSRSILVLVEMALALVLLVGAALLIRTFIAMRAVDPGFNASNVLTMRMSLAGGRFDKTAKVALLEREAERQVGRIPGVDAVSDMGWLPLTGAYDLPFSITGQPSAGPGGNTGDALWEFISPQFFNVFQIPLLRGRIFTDLDTAAAPHVVIINEAMAKQYWKKGNPVGQQILIGKGVGPEFNEAPREIVGIVGDVRDEGLNHNPPSIMYIPAAQENDGITALANTLAPIVWAVRTKVPPFSLRTQIQDALRDASGGLPVAHLETMTQVVSESTGDTSFNMTLLIIFAGGALFLAAIGIYGLIAYSVEQRTQEIGIRMALGATPPTVRNMVVRQGMRLTLIGIGIGVAGALALTRVISSMLYGVKSWDPPVFISVAVLLSLVALLATYLPARRASHVSPVEALRYE
jgi:putative ABC transport system permease protein